MFIRERNLSLRHVPASSMTSIAKTSERLLANQSSGLVPYLTRCGWTLARDLADVGLAG